MRNLLTLLCLSTFLCTCDSANSKDAETGKVFFDLKGYIAEEVNRLEGMPITVTKTITLNGETESQRLSDLDFEKDLSLFAGADINKAAWVEKYEKKTESLSGQHMITRYVARDTSLVTQLLEVEQDRGETTRINIKRKTGTVLSDGTSELIYQPTRGYSVVTKQDNRFGTDVDATVEVVW